MSGDGIWRGRGTLRIASSNAVTSSEDGYIGEVLLLDAKLEIDNRMPLSSTSLGWYLT